MTPAINDHLTARPAPGLRGFIARYSGYRDAGQPPAIHRGMPSPYLTVIFTLDEPLTIAAHPDPRQPGGEYDTLAGGLHSTPALITHDGRQSGIQLALSPLGARAVLGMPAGELAGLDVEGAALLGPLATEIQQRLQSCANWPDRFAVLDEVLLAVAAGRTGLGSTGLGGTALGGTGLGSTGPRAGAAKTEVRPEVRHAWRLLLSSGGQVSIAQLAAETGWSDRYLRSQFRVEIGMSPKAAARMIRFDRARRALARRVQAGQRPCLADLAARGGYFDQAHLNRDFGELAGCPPTTWLAEEFRNFQADPAQLVHADLHDRK